MDNARKKANEMRVNNIQKKEAAAFRLREGKDEKT